MASVWTRVGVTLIALVFSVTVVAQSYYAFEALTVPATAVGFTSATITQGGGHPQANRAMCRLETAQIRYRVDGVAPTSTVGMLLEVGDVLVVEDPVTVQQFKAIRTGATSGVLSCSYYSP